MEVVYTASTPRCGTTYTSFMLSALDGCVVTHEPLQGFSGFVHDQSVKKIPFSGWEAYGLTRIKEANGLYIESDFIFIHSSYFFAVKDIDTSKIITPPNLILSLNLKDFCNENYSTI